MTDAEPCLGRAERDVGVLGQVDAGIERREEAFAEPEQRDRPGRRYLIAYELRPGEIAVATGWRAARSAPR